MNTTDNRPRICHLCLELFPELERKLEHNNLLFCWCLNHANEMAGASQISPERKNKRFFNCEGIHR